MSARVLLALWSIVCLSLVGATRADAQGSPIYVVINAHGAKTSSQFVVPASVRLYAPVGLEHSYLYEDDGTDPKGIENIFASGRLPGFRPSSAPGAWQSYLGTAGTKAPNVVLTPLNFDKNLATDETGTTRELHYLKSNMHNRPEHWSHDTGTDAVLFVRRPAGIERLVGHAAVKRYMSSYDVPAKSYAPMNAPVILLVPKQNKVKVLGHTNLAEVADLLHGVFADRPDVRLHVLMAACNEDAAAAPRTIVLSSDAKKSVNISALFP